MNERNHQHVNGKDITQRQYTWGHMIWNNSDLMWDFVGLGSGVIGVSDDVGRC